MKESTTTSKKKITISRVDLNARKGPSKNHSVVGLIAVGDYVIEKEENGYAKLEGFDLWVDMNFVETKK